MKLQKLLKGRSPEASPVHMGKAPQDDASCRASTVSEDGAAGERVSQPNRFDVLFGRGKPYQGHAGNIRLHKVVDVYKPRYSQARRHEKTEIAEEIVQFIKSGGAKAGRFLKRSEGDESWIEVSDSVARDKVSHALRGKSRKEGSVCSKSQSSADMDDLLSTKRSPSSSVVAPAAKKQKTQPLSELELLAAAQRGSVPFNVPMLPASSLLPGASQGGLPLDLSSRLLVSAIAEQQQQLGLAQLSGLGVLGQPHLSRSTVNPLLLQSLAAEPSLRADPRLWM